MRRHLLHDKFEKPEISDHRPSLLLHVCCAPCMSAGIEALAAEYDMTAYFYDPNIVVRSEYYRRLGEVKRLIAALGLDIPVIDGGYDPAAYRAAVGNEFGGAEGGRRIAAHAVAVAHR